MLSKKYFMSFMAIALVLMSGIAIFAQTAPVRGKVTLKKQDGTESPLADASVEVYRTDAKGKLPAAKTNKKGEFSFAGFTLGQTFALVVTAPGVKSDVTPNIKGGMETITITAYEGDGKALTEDEVREALTVKPKANGTAANTGGDAPSAADVEAAKKAQAERAKLEEEYANKKKKAADNFEFVKKALDEGLKARDAKNYDLAISKFDEGINVDPDFAGSAPVLLNNKALVLRTRGFNYYSQSRTDAANRATLLESAKADFNASIVTSQRALEILNAATTTDPNEQKNYENGKYVAKANVLENHRLLIASGADRTRMTEAVAALEAYEAVEKDVAVKNKAQISLAKYINSSIGDGAEAVKIYKRVLAESPDNADAIGGYGLAIFSVGAANTNKEQMQEGLNYMDKYTQMAPPKADDTADVKEFKDSIKGSVDYLKNDQKLVPQKLTLPAPAKKKTN